MKRFELGPHRRRFGSPTTIRLASLLLLSSVLAAGAQADAPAPFVFNVAGVQAHHLLPETSRVRVSCEAYIPGANGARQRVAYGQRAFDAGPLPNPALGRGVESGPFQVLASHVERPELIASVTNWFCQMEIASGSSATTARPECSPSQVSAYSWACAKEGQNVTVLHTGRY
jgi:hypothetical protein